MKSITRILALLLLTAVLLTGAALADGADAVYDWDDILTDSEEAALTGAAEEVAAKYDVGVYIAVLPDMEDYGFYDIEACAEAFYTDMELGVGAEKTGILLILSMAERDYDLCAYGSFGHYAFTDYGKTTISDEFLDNFRRNDWYGGFADYIARTEELLIQAKDGAPVDVPPRERFTPAGVVASLVIGALVAWGICSALKGKMKTARIAADADSYVRPGGAQITARDDRFTHVTTSRRKIESSSSSGGGRGGGTHVSSGGFSHSSGKF